MKITPFYCLSEQDQQKVREARLKEKYNYKKGRFSLDKTYYYNKYIQK